MMFITEMKCTFKAVGTPPTLILQPMPVEAEVLLCI
jgi:hypothetical protein